MAHGSWTRLRALLALAAVLALPVAARTEPVWHHALSLVGEPAYPADFAHFNWVNPEAPKGGSVTLSWVGTFDTFNSLPPNGNVVIGLGLIYDSLMTGSLDEPSTEYGLVAESVSHPEDYSSVTFRLRKEARFHDGSPITPDDVIFSFEKQKEIDPFSAQYYKNVVKAEMTSDTEVTFTFDVKGNRELPHIMGQLTIFPKHYWTANGADGTPRDLARSTLEPPLGSGPYRIKSFDAGKYIVYERVADYWAKDLPVSRGMNNLDQIRWDYYRDQTIAFEAFRAGKVDYYAETSAKNWATGYDFEKLKEGFVVQRKVELQSPEGMQSFAFNTRRSKFQDPRVRQAFNLAFDFENANKVLFYGQYVRTDSFFENSELASSGLPSPAELEILTPLKDSIPPAVFTTEWKNPVNDTPAEIRTHLREATRLLKEAGWSVKSNVLTNDATGEQMTVEFLIDTPIWERIILPYVKSLERLGIKASVRTIDDSQYQRRVTNFDYDIVVASFPQSESPGNEQRDFWGTVAADKPGTRNIIGIKNPAIDTLIDHVIFAKSRDELVAATHALDRVLLWNHYVVPMWHISYDRIAYWDKYKRPDPGPSRFTAFPTVWWYDKEAAARVEPAQRK
ncbi:MAG: extracellular solute-binding protein [Hyphomicrobiaceae bacterium]